MAQAKEQTLSIDVANEAKKAVLASIESPIPKPSKEGAGVDLRKPETAMERVLNMVLARIVIARNYAELGSTLEKVSAKLADDLSPEMLDQLKGQVIDTARQLGKDSDSRLTDLIKHHFDRHEYVQAAEVLKKTVDSAGNWLDPNGKNELNVALGMVKDNMTDDERAALIKYMMEKIEPQISESNKDLSDKFEVLQSALVRKEYDVAMKPPDPNAPVRNVETKVKIKDAQKIAIRTEVGAMNDMENRDVRLILDLVGGQEIFGARDARGGDRTWDVSKMKDDQLRFIWLRTSGLLGRYENQLASSPETRKMLEQLRDASRETLLTKNSIGNEPLKKETIEKKNRAKGKNRSSRGLEFFEDYMKENETIDFNAILELQVQEMINKGFDPEIEISNRTEAAFAALFATHPELRANFKNEGGKWSWLGDSREFFDLCRDEIYTLQGQLTGENMGNLIFEDSAQLYLALMRVDVRNNPELQDVKDAITKMLYIDYAVKSMWQGGGNAEVWQRIARILTRERDKSFFEIMGIGEKLKFQGKDGKEIVIRDENGKRIDLGRFTADDIMSLSDMKAEGVSDRYWSTELAAQSTNRKEKVVKPRFAQAVATRAIENKVLVGELSRSVADELIAKIKSGDLEIDGMQADWMMRYEQYLDNSTLRAGERGFNQAKDSGKFQITDNPLGEFAVKNGPWSAIYYYQYEVTKYGGDFIGEVFLPNTSMLSFARGETLAHFIKAKSSVEAGLVNENGEYVETGVGAVDFFFKGNKSQEKNAEMLVDFFGDVIFDTRTGTVGKTAVHRTVDQIRLLGGKKLDGLRRSGKLGFVDSMDFSNLELLLGSKLGKADFVIPGPDNQAKFKWIVENFDYRFWRYDILKSKREADWVNKYVPVKYTETVKLFQDFCNAPSLDTKMKVVDKIGEYSGGEGMETFETQAQKAIDKNNEYHIWGWETSPGSAGKAKWNESRDGADDFYSVKKEKHWAWEGWYGNGFANSIQQAKERYRYPMYFEKMEIENRFYNGLIDRKGLSKQMWEWHKKAYLGDVVKVGKYIKFRPGYFPLLTPFYLFRGWWVDRMGLDWEAFKIVFTKNNEESWEKLKKLMKI